MRQAMGLECSAVVLPHRSDLEEDGMQCPQCQHENREGAKFYNQCGIVLTGQEVEYAAKFLERIFSQEKC